MVFCHEEIHLVLLLVADIKQFKITNPDVSPKLNRFEQMAGDNRFIPFALVINARPVTEVPLVRLR